MNFIIFAKLFISGELFSSHTSKDPNASFSTSDKLNPLTKESFSYLFKFIMTYLKSGMVLIMVMMSLDMP